MPDINTTRQEFLNTLLALKSASKVNLQLLAKLFEQTLGSAYARNAELMNATKAVLKENVKRDMLIADGSTPSKISPVINNRLNKTITSLNKLNDSRKQLLASADKVRLSVVMLGNESLPKAQAQLYNKSINKILERVDNMTVQMQVKLNMKQGVNIGKLPASKLAALDKGLTQSLTQLLQLNATLKTQLSQSRQASPEADKTDDHDHKPASPFSTTLKRGRK
jgi:hypothetical protein